MARALPDYCASNHLHEVHHSEILDGGHVLDEDVRESSAQLYAVARAENPHLPMLDLSYPGAVAQLKAVGYRSDNLAQYSREDLRGMAEDALVLLELHHGLRRHADRERELGIDPDTFGAHVIGEFRTVLKNVDERPKARTDVKG